MAAHVIAASENYIYYFLKLQDHVDIEGFPYL
jgi:hypothetical protein